MESGLDRIVETENGERHTHQNDCSNHESNDELVSRVEQFQMSGTQLSYSRARAREPSSNGGPSDRGHVRCYRRGVMPRLFPDQVQVRSRLRNGVERMRL